MSINFSKYENPKLLKAQENSKIFLVKGKDDKKDYVLKKIITKIKKISKILKAKLKNYLYLILIILLNIILLHGLKIVFLS